MLALGPRALSRCVLQTLLVLSRARLGPFARPDMEIASDEVIIARAVKITSESVENGPAIYRYRIVEGGGGGARQPRRVLENRLKLKGEVDRRSYGSTPDGQCVKMTDSVFGMRYTPCRQDAAFK